jgi:hypothetical protein
MFNGLIGVPELIVLGVIVVYLVLGGLAVIRRLERK